MGSNGNGGGVFGTIATGGLSQLPGLYGQLSGANQMDQAAGNAAKAQLAQAQANYGTVQGIGSQMTTQGLAQYGQQLNQINNQLGQQQTMLQNVDPELMQASQNALALMQGQASPYLQPIEAQRSQQRQQLVNSLMQQQGPGALTSTAGIQALNQFDTQTNSLLSNQQQSALGLMNQSAGMYGQMAQGLNAGINTNLSQIGQNAGAQAGLQQAYAGMLNQANAPVYQSAGAPYVASQLQGQQQMGFFNQMLNAGVTGGMYGMMSPGGGGGGGMSSMMSSASSGGMTANANPMASGQMFNYSM